MNREAQIIRILGYEVEEEPMDYTITITVKIEQTGSQSSEAAASFGLPEGELSYLDDHSWARKLNELLRLITRDARRNFVLINS